MTLAGVTMRATMTKVASMATVPTMPLRDFVNTIAPSISTTITGAEQPLEHGPGRLTYISASGMNAARFSARSFGFWKKPPTGPAARSPSTRLMPRA